MNSGARDTCAVLFEMRCHQRLALARLQPLDGGPQRGGRLDGVVGGADAHGVPTMGAEAGGGPELQLRPGGVDQEVVADAFRPSGLVTGRVLDVDPGAIRRLVAAGMDGRGLRLDEPDALLLVDGRKREHHLFLGHLPDPHPDVAGDPVPLRVRGHHDHIVGCSQLALSVQGRRVPRNPRTEYDDPSHDAISPSTVTTASCSVL